MIKEFEKINVYCFDMNQYNRQAYSIYVIVFANYQGRSYYSKDIELSTDSCEWDGWKWQLPKYLDIIKRYGLLFIMKHIHDEKQYL